jgi:hypothetical protein
VGEGIARALGARTEGIGLRSSAALAARFSLYLFPSTYLLTYCRINRVQTCLTRQL